MSRRLVHSSLANLCVSHEVYLWNVSIQEDSVRSCDPFDDEETTAFPTEEDEAIREWRQEFPGKRDVLSFEFTPTLVILKIRRSQR